MTLGTRIRGLWLLSALAAGFTSVGCVFVFNRMQTRPLERPSDTTAVVVSSPVKAHLLDGSTVVYREGVVVTRDTLRGRGTRYDLALRDSTWVTRVPLDSVVGMEAFRHQVLGAQSFAVSVLASGAAAFGTALLLIAIFGSCPTFYADSAGVPTLQAEAFSYSIAPLFESRDVDRLRVRVDADGAVRLEVRNEAAETHYINHLELLEVRHGRDEVAVPDAWHRATVVAGLVPPAAAVDGTGRDVRRTLSAEDGEGYRTSRVVLHRVRPGDLDDHVDLVFPRPPGADSVALVLRLRNSLLNTVLLYDLMLGARGARALDWVGRDLERIGPAVELGQWYQERMGLRVLVWDGDAYRPVGRVRDVGPIAWKETAVVVPAPVGDSVRLRLEFTADNWRIDYAALAARVRRPAVRALPLARVVGSDGAADAEALASLSAADRHYLQTTPGQRFQAVFDAGRAPADAERTFFLSAQGYYVEWIRPQWIAAGSDSTAFRPSDESLLDALARWREVQATFERRFETARVPVR